MTVTVVVPDDESNGCPNCGIPVYQAEALLAGMACGGVQRLSERMALGCVMEAASGQGGKFSQPRGRISILISLSLYLLNGSK